VTYRYQHSLSPRITCVQLQHSHDAKPYYPGPD